MNIELLTLINNKFFFLFIINYQLRTRGVYCITCKYTKDLVLDEKVNCTLLLDMTKEIKMEQDKTERKLSVPKICHDFEADENKATGNSKLLHRRKMLNSDIPNLNTLTLNTNAHGRSCSFRNRPRPKLLDVDFDRPRRSSLPSPVSSHHLSVSFEDINRRESSQQPLQRVRSFKTTTKGGVVNRGDSFKRSTNSINSTGSVIVNNNAASNRERANSAHSKESANVESIASSSDNQVYKVAMLGDKGVGKTSLTNQFMTSDFVAFENDQGMIYFFKLIIII